MQSKEQIDDKYRFILMVLLREGPLNSKELKDKWFLFTSHFRNFGLSIVPFINPDKINQSRHYKKDIELRTNLDELHERNIITLNRNGRYELTEKGKDVLILHPK